MKKILAFIVCAVVALTFAACAAPQTKKSFTYRFGTITEETDGLLESFVYHVEAQEQDLTSSISSPYYISGSGEYRVNIYQEENRFKIETDFTFDGTYKFKGGDESATFTDTIHAVSYAAISSFSFTPISAEKTYNITLPEYSEAENKYILKRANFTAQTQYGKSGNNLTIESSVTDSEGAEKNIKNKDNEDVNITVGGAYVENEHIFLQLRLQNIDAKFSDRFKVHDSISGVLKNITVATSQNFEDKSFYGTDGESYKCYVLSAAIDDKYKGSDTLMYFAQEYNHKYQNSGGEYDTVNVNLLIEFKHGNLIYQLSEYTNYAVKE